MVLTLARCKRPWRHTSRESSSSVISTPISTSLAVIHSRCLGMTLHAHLAAGGGHRCHIGARLDLVGDDGVAPAGQMPHTPHLDHVGAAPMMSAPMELRKLARSTIWGSWPRFR